MRPINKAAFIRTAIITLLSSWFTWICIWPSACNKSHPGKIQQESQLLQAEHSRIVASFKREQFESRQINDSLQRQLAETKKELIKYQQKSRAGKSGVLYHLNHDSKDTAIKLAHCDSLKTMVAQYVQIVHEEDSVQQKTISELETLLGQKDTALSQCNDAFTSMSELCTKSIDQQAALENELHSANQKLEIRAKTIKVLGAVSIGLVAITTLVVSR